MVPMPLLTANAVSQTQLNDNAQRLLLSKARESICHGLTSRARLEVDPLDYDMELRRHVATFVTLYRINELQGCIGSLTAQRPLISDVVYNAHMAAFNDPRFSSLNHESMAALNIELALLSPLQPLQITSEEELFALLEPGVHGLLIESQGHRATFLPKVWRSFESKNEFLTQLKRKAGLSDNYWSAHLQASIYTTQVIRE